MKQIVFGVKDSNTCHSAPPPHNNVANGSAHTVSALRRGDNKMYVFDYARLCLRQFCHFLRSSLSVYLVIFIGKGIYNIIEPLLPSGYYITMLLLLSKLNCHQVYRVSLYN